MTTEYTEEASAWEERVGIVRQHYEGKGYRVHSGLQFGCELVLYADDPSKVHSDFCVHVVPEGRCFELFPNARFRCLLVLFSQEWIDLSTYLSRPLGFSEIIRK